MTDGHTTQAHCPQTGTTPGRRAHMPAFAVAHPAGSGLPYDVSELVPRLMHASAAARDGRLTADSERRLLRRLATQLLTELSASDPSSLGPEPVEALRRDLRRRARRSPGVWNRRRSPLEVPTAN